jgi:hypothetical protein
LLLKQLKTCPNNQLPMYAEMSATMVNDSQQRGIQQSRGGARGASLAKESQRKRVAEGFEKSNGLRAPQQHFHVQAIALQAFLMAGCPHCGGGAVVIVLADVSRNPRQPRVLRRIDRSRPKRKTMYLQIPVGPVIRETTRVGTRRFIAP